MMTLTFPFPDSYLVDMNRCFSQEVLQQRPPKPQRQQQYLRRVEGKGKGKGNRGGGRAQRATEAATTALPGATLLERFDESLTLLQ